MKKITLLISLILVLLLAACGSNSTSSNNSTEKENNKDTKSENQETEGPIKIGSTLALTGPAGFLGSGMKKAFDFKIKQINDEGGINGRPIEIVYLDDENNPENTVKNAKKLIQSEGVEVILGPSVGATSKAIENIIEENEVLMYSLSGAYNGPANSYAFGASYSSEVMHDVIHSWAKSEGLEKVGMIATNDASGTLAVDIVKKLDGQDGIEYLIENMGVQDLDVTPQLTKLKSKGIEALVVVGPGGAAGVAIKSANQVVSDLPIIATHSQLSESFAQSIKEFIPEKMYITGIPVMAPEKLSDKNPIKSTLIEFANEYEAEFGAKPDFITAVGYDALLIVLEGLKAVGNDGPKLKEYLENNIKDFKGAHAIFNLSPEDHRGTSSEGAVLVKLNKDLSWDIAWDESDK